MSRALVAFGSSTGNTAEVAQWISGWLGERGFDVTTEDCSEALVEQLFDPYDLVVLGCPTYGDDPVEVQEDFVPVLENLEHTAIAGKNVAVFGTGDSSYTHFCGAVDLIEDKVRDCGGKLIVESLRIDSPYLGFKPEVQQWVGRVADAA